MGLSGLGQLVKTLVNQAHRDWLDHDENLEKWLGKGLLSAKERRILITHWVGQAWDRVTGADYKSSLWRFFQKTGCLITADGSEDALIQPEGLPNYAIPPVSFASPLQQPESQDAPLPRTPEDDPLSIESDSEDEGTEERVDYEQDRNYNDINVGRKVKALYENGWHTGKIHYLNTDFGEYKIDFPDGSVDYISPDEIGGAEVYFV